MNYYEYLLPNTNAGLKRIKRVFLILAAFHFSTGLIVAIIFAIIYPILAVIPGVWFLIGFVYGNIAYLFVTDYKYVFDNGVFRVYRHRRFGNYRSVVAVPINEMDWDCVAAKKTKHCTNSAENARFCFQDVTYIVTVDDYMLSLLKGEIHVS